MIVEAYPTITLREFRSLPIMNGIVAPLNVPFLTVWLVEQLRSKLEDGRMVFYMVRVQLNSMEVRAAVISGEE